MKRAAVLALTLVGTSAMAQTSALGEPKFVAPEVNSVSWSPDGKDLTYALKDQAGNFRSIGGYDLATTRGQELLKLKDEQKVKAAEWLNGRGIRLFVIEETVSGRAAPTVREALWALDCVSLKASQLWSLEYPQDQNPNLDIDVSPLIPHAIVTVNAGKSTSMFVVTSGAGSMVYSRDLNEAAAHGVTLAGWSTDGTGLFGSFGPKGLQEFKIDGGTITFGGPIDVTGSGNAIEIKIEPASSGEAPVATVQGQALNFVFARARPDIPVGASVLECVPSNGSLRPIKFKAYFQEPKGAPESVKSTSQMTGLSFGRSTEGTNALWLTDNVDKPESGVLVSPQAENAWMAPGGKWIAFTFNRVLFLRAVKAPKG